MQLPDNKNLASRFSEYFKVELVTSQQQRDNVFKIRYRVYCDEFKFLDADNYQDDLEYDAYDDVSQLCLITHKSTGFPAACARIIPAVSSEGDPIVLPYENLGAEILDQNFFRDFDVPRQTLCEISRLAVDGAFRRRSGEAATRFGEIDSLDITQIEKRTFGLIAVAAFLASAAISDMASFSNGFAMMEPFLPRLMRRSGIHFKRAGRDIDYHGVRAPYFIKMQSFNERMNSDLREFYEEIRDGIINGQ